MVLDEIKSALKIVRIMGVINMKKVTDWIRANPVLTIIFFVVLLVTALAFFLLNEGHPSLILPVVGVASFAIPIVLSFDDRYNLGTRLDNGEVRKAIAVALTVVYIIMLSLFFINVTLPQQPGNVSDQKDISCVVSGENALILPLLIQPAAAENQSNSTTTPVNDTTNQTDTSNSTPALAGTNESGGAEVCAQGTNNSTVESMIGKIPASALGDIYRNFLYVYILIIGFYFGSRVFEDFAGVRMTKELKGFDPEDLLKKRFAMGEISDDDYRTRIVLLEKQQDLAFYIDKTAEKIRILNMSNKEMRFKELYIDGISVLDPKEERIGAKDHKDFEIKGDLKDTKDTYLVRLVTDSGSNIKDIAAAIKL
jgi:uncharacterized membrane protein